MTNYLAAMVFWVKATNVNDIAMMGTYPSGYARFSERTVLYSTVIVSNKVLVVPGIHTNILETIKLTNGPPQLRVFSEHGPVKIYRLEEVK